MDVRPPSPPLTQTDPLNAAFAAGWAAALAGVAVEIGCPANLEPQLAVAYRNGYAMGLVEAQTPVADA